MSDTVGSSELAKVLKITVRRVNQLVEDNILFREQNGKFNLADSAENFYAYKFKTDGKFDYDKEHALFERAKREKAQLDLQIQKGQLLKAEDVEVLMSGMIINCKMKLLAIPAKTSPKLTSQNNPMLIADILRQDICEALEELKELPAEKVIEDAPDD